MLPLQFLKLYGRLLLAIIAMLFASAAQADGTVQELGPQQSVDGSPIIKAPVQRAGGVYATPRASSPGEVEITPYGQFEEDAAFRDGGFLAVRFDPPFRPPFTIKSIRFPSFSIDGSPAVFPSIRLLTYVGRFPTLPINNPLFKTEAYVASANGANEIPLDIAVNDSGMTFYACFEFPSTTIAGFPKGFPFMRMDYSDLERGLFGASCSVSPTGTAVNNMDRNIIASLVCQLPEPADVPIESSSNLGANRRLSDIEFTFTRPRDLRMDGTVMPKHSLLQTLLLFRTNFGSWTVVDSAGPGETAISRLSLPPGGRLVWSSQAMDKSGNRSVLSSGLYTSGDLLSGICEDSYEPNGDLREGRPVGLSTAQRFAMSYPAGDKDYYTFHANPGDTFEALVSARYDGKNDLQLIVVLYDQSGKVIEIGKKSADGTFTTLTYSVPFRSPRARDNAPRQFTMMIQDINGSFLAPDSPPRVAWDQSFECPEYFWGIRDLSSEAEVGVDPGQEVKPRLTAIRSGSRGLSLFYTLPLDWDAARTSIRIFDVQGRLVRTLLNGAETGVERAVSWDGLGDDRGALPSGIYFARLENPAGGKTTKIVLTR